MLDHCRRPDIETRHRSQCGERRRIARRPRAGLPTALIDAISCQVRFTVGVPSQRSTPRCTRPQHKNTEKGFYPSHTDTPIVFLRQQAHPSWRSQLLTCKSLFRIAQLTRLPGERLKRGTTDLFTVETTQGACLRRKRMARTKS